MIMTNASTLHSTPFPQRPDGWTCSFPLRSSRSSRREEKVRLTHDVFGVNLVQWTLHSMLWAVIVLH
jgi:hypothetical protein